MTSIKERGGKSETPQEKVTKNFIQNSSEDPCEESNLYSWMTFYVTGISSTSRAVCYFLLITYLSYAYFDDKLQSSFFMADPRNPFNLYFVKYAWGWTFSAVFLFMILSNYIQSGSWLSENAFRSGCRLAVGTLVWYLHARMLFPMIEEFSGVCEVSSLLSKKSCYLAGHFWRGFDISGHCFLLSWNNLFIVEECQMFFQKNRTLKRDRTGSGDTSEKQEKLNLLGYLQYLKYALAFLMLMGEMMMLFTAVYFHTLPEKIVGTLFGLLPWYIMYKMVYKKKWHPSYLLEEDK